MRERPEREQARQMYLNGSKYPEIIAALNVSKGTVSKWCSDLVPVRVAKPRSARFVRLAEEKAPRQLKSYEGQAPYAGFRYYITVGEDGISRVQLICRETGKRYWMTMAKYLLAVKLGRRLEKGERVEHIDGNSRNDALDNLRIRVASEWKGREYDCVICEEKFHARRAKETCSRECKNILMSGIIKGSKIEVDDEKLSQIIDLRSRAMSYQEISSVVGISRSTVARYLKPQKSLV